MSYFFLLFLICGHMVRHGPPIIPYWHNEDWGHCVWRNWVAFLSLSTSSWVTIHHILVQGKLKAEVDIVSSLDEQARPKPHFRKAILLLKCMILQISKIWRVDNQIKRRPCLVPNFFHKSLSHQKESYYFIVLNKICL